MADTYSNKEREKIRVKFAKLRRDEKSIEASCEVAGISPSTYYEWNENDDWKKANGWSKGDGWGK